VYHLNNERKVIAYHRWDKGGVSDDVVIVANFSHDAQEDYVIGFPSEGAWKLRFNSDWEGYNDDFGNYLSTDILTDRGECDGLPYYASVSIGAYSVVIFSQ
jgi:1,4-alpha-glucan branching enzyme